MSLLQQLLTAHSRANANTILKMVLADQDLLPELMDTFFNHQEIKVVQRAAMIVGDLGRKRPGWLTPYHESLLSYAEVPPHPAVSRNIIRHFGEYPREFPEELEGRLLDLSLRLIADEQQPVAPRVFAMPLALKLCKKYPDISSELRAAIEGSMEYGTAGFKSRGRRTLAALDKL